MDKFILSLATEDFIPNQFLKDMILSLEGFGIKIDHSVSDTEGNLKAINILAHGSQEVDEKKLKIEILRLSNLHKVDVAFLKKDAFERPKKLIVFDMDSTLIQHEVIDEMALVHGIGEKVKIITERAMNGELNFNEALRERVALLQGLPRETMEKIYSSLNLSPGAEALISTLKNHGYKTAIISGGFRYFAEKFKDRLGMDYAFANDLVWDGEFLKGEVAGEIINAQKKADLLEEIARLEKIDLSDVVAVGDGANDLLMLAKAGIGIAYHAKEKVRLEARHHVSHGPMTTILYFLGIPGDHFV